MATMSIVVSDELKGQLQAFAEANHMNLSDCVRASAILSIINNTSELALNTALSIGKNGVSDATGARAVMDSISNLKQSVPVEEPPKPAPKKVAGGSFADIKIGEVDDSI